MGGFWVLAIIVITSLGALGVWVAAQKGRAPLEGLILGVLFGPLGVIVEGLLPVGMPEEEEAGSAPRFAAPARRGWELPRGATERKKEPPPPEIEDIRL